MLHLLTINMNNDIRRTMDVIIDVDRILSYSIL